MKLLFAHSFFLYLDPKQREIQAPYPPLGTIVAAAQAREAGHDVALFDAMLATGPTAIRRALAADSYDAVVFFEDNFNWLSKMCLLNMRHACFEMLEIVRSAEIPTYVAGSDPSDFPEAYLRAGADYVIKGEAEFRLLELLESGEPGPGVFYIKDDQLAGMLPLKPEKDLSKFAAPAWDLINIAPYRSMWLEKHGYFSLNMVTTRGCPYGCNWCAKPIHGRRYDIREPKAVAREMAALKTSVAPDHIWFADDIFGLRAGWVEEFADEIEQLNGRIPFKIQARADLMSERTVAALKRAGCKTVWMGVESGSQKILDAMDKDLDVEAVYVAAERLRKAGIELCFFLQLGYPGEELADIKLTWEMVRRTQPDDIGISVSYPLPDTSFHEAVKDQLVDFDHWQHSNFMQPIHQATFPAEVYPVLYKYFHQKFMQLRPPSSRLRRLKRAAQHLQTRRQLEAYGIEGLAF